MDRPRSNPSVRIIAVGMILMFCYYASSVILTLLVSILAAFVLDPVVNLMERGRMPRALSALLVLLAAMLILSLLGYLFVDRVDQFAGDWPRYSRLLKTAVQTVQDRIDQLESRFREIVPRGRTRVREVAIAEPVSLSRFLLRGIGSIYGVLLTVAFMPFLVFFMLASKRSLWHHTMELFPLERRHRAKQTLDDLSKMLRGYVMGNLIVMFVLIAATFVFFWLIDLEYPFLAAIVSGIVNLIPYLGVPLALFPPFLLGAARYTSAGPFVGIALVLIAFHVVAVNLLVPKLVGPRVRLNALAVTVALMFWGWLWGAVGLVLAIPIAAGIKVVCDHVDGWEPVGRWLGPT
ncbi:MAG TPA: AI-2E family transporter [Candidatus Acidoferrales bacterium]